MTDEKTESEPKPKKPKARRAKPNADQPSQEEIASARSYVESRNALRYKVRMFYDLQRMRLQVEGRVTPKADDKQIQLHPVDVNLLLTRVADLAKAEKEALKDVEDHLKTMPVWTKLLSDRDRFRGLGVTMAAVIVSENDIYRQDTVSKMWAFAGLNPVPAWRCANCDAVMRVLEPGKYKHPDSKCVVAIKVGGERIFDDTLVYAGGRAAHAIKGEKLAFNKWLRTKLLGVLGPCMLKAGSPYRSAYDNYKARKVELEWGTGNAHRHQAAMRYMVKMLLIDIHHDWRILEGLPARRPYHEAILGHVHVGSQAIGANDFPVDPSFDPDRDGHIFERESLARGEESAD